MAPNSDEGRRIEIFPWADENTKEKQRPPIYNPEDYALSLKKWGRRPPVNGPGLYSNIIASEAEITKTQGHNYRDYRNPMLVSSGSEMTLRQFGTVTELLSKLKNDLRLAYPSFVQEFIADPLDGVTLLLELLRAVQLSQSNGSSAGSTGTTGKISPAIQRRALLDELSCLQCLHCCCTRFTEAVRKLTASSAGLFTLAVCIMSNVNKSRIIALQLLTKACEPHGNGNVAVSEALSTLRLRFGEPVRFRFLVGMLSSAGGQGELLSTGMKFINTFLDTAGSMQRRLYVQAELEQAGFDIATIKKNITINSQFADQIFEELNHWDKKHVDAETLTIRLEASEKQNDSLRDKVLLLERKIQILQEEKGVLISLEQCLKERCSELQEEVVSLKSPNSDCNLSKRGGSTPAEDEGISSSERSLSPEDLLQREPSVYEMYNVQNETLKLSDEEEETTIEEVIEELRNIINEAETEVYNKETKDLLAKEEAARIRMEEAQIKGKIDLCVDESLVGSESDIIPCNLHPQPPRKTRSLVHLYIPTTDADYYNKEIFFENETAYNTSDGSSDSLLSASKCQLPRVDRELPISNGNNNNRAILNTIMDARERAHNFDKRSSAKRDSLTRKEINQRNKSKSLDRIADGLDAIVDIVVTKKLETSNLRTKSDSGNITISTMSRSNSNLFAIRNKTQYENPKMFLPVHKYEERGSNETRYYFPRIQEKRATTAAVTTNSFLIKRGHGNAGMYSGQNITKTSEFSGGNVAKKIDYFATSGSRNSSSKLTDLPSGLY